MSLLYVFALRSGLSHLRGDEATDGSERMAALHMVYEYIQLQRILLIYAGCGFYFRLPRVWTCLRKTVTQTSRVALGASLEVLALVSF